MDNFSVIIPVYNEADLLFYSISKLVNELKQIRSYGWEIILIENGSTDQSWEICQKLCNFFPEYIVLLKICKPNYGFALKKGIMSAKFKNIVIANVDFWDIPFISKSLRLLESCDMVVGSKTLIKSKDLRPVYRRVITYWFNVFLRSIYNFPGTDTHGLKAFKKQSLMPIVTNLYPLKELFDTQMVLTACKNDLIYTEIPISVREVRSTRYSFFRRIINLIYDLAIIFKNRYL